MPLGNADHCSKLFRYCLKGKYPAPNIDYKTLGVLANGLSTDQILNVVRRAENIQLKREAKAVFYDIVSGNFFGASLHFVSKTRFFIL